MQRIFFQMIYLNSLFNFNSVLKKKQNRKKLFFRRHQVIRLPISETAGQTGNVDQSNHNNYYYWLDWL